MPKADIPVDMSKILTVLDRKVEKSKNGCLSSVLFLSFIFRLILFWFLRCSMARRCGWYNDADR